MNKDKFVLPANVHIDEFDVDVRPYLTLEEVATIAEAMMKAEDWCQMEIAFNYGILTNCVVNAEELNGIDYEVLKHSGFINAVVARISNDYDIYDYIKAKTSNTAMLGEFLKEFVKVLDKAQKKLPKKAELTDIINQAKDLMQK